MRRQNADLGTALHAARNGVFPVIVGAAFQLFLLCGFVGWLLHSGRIPDETAPVLSKVAFNALIPCMLFTKVGATLAARPDPALLAIPLVAAAQVGIGAAAGWVAARWVGSKDQGPPGWHARKGGAAARTMALTTAAAAGVPAAAGALLARPPPAQAGAQEMTAAACAFGNSLTLPLVFLAALLPAAAYERAVGYTALFLMGWSPLLWSVGYKLLGSAGDLADETGAELTRIPYGGNFVAGGGSEAAADARRALVSNAGLRRPRTVRVRARLALEAVRRSFTAARGAVMRSLNPPLLGTLVGIAAGLSPGGSVLFAPASAAARESAARLPLELLATLGAVRSLVQAAGILAGATLAVQAVVLGGSGRSGAWLPPLRPAGVPANPSSPKGSGNGVSGRPPSEGRAAAADVPPYDSGQGSAGPGGDGRAERPSQNLLRALLPASRADRDVFLAVALVRSLVVPAATTALVAALHAARLLPADPVCCLALLVQGAMPSAQNLVVILQIKAATQPLAPRMAALLLRLYVWSVVPVSLWVSLFVAGFSVPLAAM
ncbi:hypothetical protein WJX81_002161 [Elliptochloris bilobata]|uniref:Auxin efflux carrier n=1 Tax=Elliptochloris bilobata TaxID=381761 RepID=A0AAW1S0V2_9CHLO